MANTISNTSIGKPKVSGGIYRAPTGTTLPDDASTELATAFKCLGYVSDDGVTNTRDNDTEIKAWGGDVVYATKTDTFKLKLIECMNVEVLKTVYGDDNVTGTDETGISIKANDGTQENNVFVIELMLRGHLKRIVIPCGQVVSVGEVKYADGDSIGYETTIQANTDSSNNTHYEYIAKATT